MDINVEVLRKVGCKEVLNVRGRVDERGERRWRGELRESLGRGERMRYGGLGEEERN